MKGRLRLDLNGDVGEGAASDGDLIALLTSANVACGGHAGDGDSMARTIDLTLRHGVVLGAHPGHEDRDHFGRLEIAITPAAASALVERQVGALARAAESFGATIHHVKPHGALYHQLGRDLELARAFVGAVTRFDRRCAVVGMAGSCLDQAALEAGLTYRRELFADRRYGADGRLLPRSQPGALIEREDEAVAQVLSMVVRGRVRTTEGSEVVVVGETLCVHGDSPHALAFARRLRAELAAAGVDVVGAR